VGVPEFYGPPAGQKMRVIVASHQGNRALGEKTLNCGPTTLVRGAARRPPGCLGGGA
jgi:hypothetical protein